MRALAPGRLGLCLFCLVGGLLASLFPLQAQTVSTLAGTGTAGFSGDTGSPSSAQLNLPSSVFGDGLGNIFIADTGNHRIRSMPSALTPIDTYAGTGAPGYSGDGGLATAAQLSSPSGLFATPAGTLYVADAGNHAIRMITPAGTITTVAGDGSLGFTGDGGPATAAQLNSPSGVFVDGVGVIYIADTGNNRIRRVIGTTITTIAGDSTAAFSGDGGPAAAAQLNAPSGVFQDTSGILYIADTGNHRIRAITLADSTIATFAGSENPGFSGDGDIPTNARFAFPEAVFADTLGNVFVADSFNQRVRRLNAVGNVTTLAGDGTLSFGGDGGAANLSQLANPTGLFLTTAQTLLIADRDNHRIRRIVSDNVSGLSGSTAIGPTREVQIFQTNITGDGNSSVHSLTLTVADLSTPTGLTNTDFLEFRLYSSDDATLGAGDDLLGTIDSAAVQIGNPFTISVAPVLIPDLAETVYFLVSAIMSEQAVEGHSFKVGFDTGNLSTSSGGRVYRVAAADADKVTVDVVATKLVFTAQPAGSVSGNPLLTQPALTALDDLGFVDTGFSDLITLTTTAPGTLLFNTSTAVSGVATFTNVTYLAALDNETFVLTADDEVGGAEGDLPAIIANPVFSNKVNDAPVVSLISFVLKEDESFSNPLSDFVTDVDDSVLTISSISSHFTVSVVEEDLFFDPEPDFFGRDTITVIATDPFGAQGSSQMIIEVTPVNDAPEIAPLSNLVFDEDDSLEIDLRAQIDDPDDIFDDLIITLTPSPGLSVAFDQTTGSLQLSAPPDSSGEFTLIIFVKDKTTVFDTRTVLISIVPVNDLPTFSLPDISLLQGDSAFFDLSAYVSDVEDSPAEFTWQAQFTANTSVTLIGGAATIVPLPSFSGADTLTFTAIDAGGASAADTVIVEVIAVNQAPSFSSIPDTTLTGGDTLEIDLRSFVTDPDDEIESLSLSVSPASRGESMVIDGQLRLTTESDVVYTENLEVVVTDPGGKSDTTSISVNAVPWPGIILGIPDLSFEIGMEQEFVLDDYLISGIEPASIEWTATRIGDFAVVIDAESRVVTVRSEGGWKGTGEIRFEAMDEAGRTDLDTISVTVANPVPRIDFPDSLFVDAGGSIQLFLDDFAQDDEALELLTWTAEADSGAIVRIDPILRFLTITASAEFAGLTAVTLSAQDVQGDIGFDRVVMNVRADLPDDTPGSGIPDRPDTSLAPDNEAPRVSLPETIEFSGTGFSQLRLDLHVSDDSPVGFLSWSAQTDSALVVEIDALTRVATISAAPGFEGEAQVLFVAVDPQGDFGSGTTLVRVLPQVAPEPGDFDGSGRIGLEDFFRLADHLGLTVLHADWNPAFDLDEDGRISFDDFFLFIDIFSNSQSN